MKLSQKVVDELSCPSEKRAAIFWDDESPGLGVRIQGTARSWIVRYRVRGKTNPGQKTLGPCSALKLKEARVRALDFVRAGLNGEDLAVAQRNASAEEQRRQAADRVKKVGTLVDAYMAHAASELRPSTHKQAAHYLKVVWLPLHELIAEEIDRRSIVSVLEKVALERGPVAANRARAYLSMCMAWAMDRAIIERNPVVGLRPLASEKSRERVLDQSEIAVLWQSAGADDFGVIARLLLLTGARRSEVSGMAWNEIDPRRELWTVPPARTKNGRPHDVPLSSQVRTILDGHARVAGRPYVFGRGRSGFTGWGAGKARLDRSMAAARAKLRLGRPLAVDEEIAAEDRLAPWTLHDVRRSVVTHMAEIGIAPHIIEAIVNHVSGHKGGVAGVYNRAEYAHEKRISLQRWADHVESIANQSVSTA